MIKNKEIILKKNNSYNNYYKKLGYNIQEIFVVKIDDLQITSTVLVDVICDYCGFEKKIPYKQYINNLSNKNKYSCSLKCSKNKTKETNLEKYGVENISQSIDIQNKIKQSNLEKYGVTHTSKLDCNKNKRKKTNLEKYGVEYQTQRVDIQNKIKQSNLEKYGVENISQSIDIQNKIKQSNLEKYGVTHTSKLDCNKNKRRETNLEKYGVEYLFELIEYRKENNVKIKKIKNVKYSLYFKKMFEKSEYNFLEYKDKEIKLVHCKCNHHFTINKTIIFNRFIKNMCLCTECYPIGDNKSIKEKEIINWLKELDINFIESDKTILSPKHLDIYIPSHNLGIEMNGLYWHSEIYKDKNYHLEKSLKCLEQGIQLLHIWEDEWVFKKDIVKSIILNKLGLISEKIYARQCEIRVIEDSKLVREFLDKNHIQGYCQSSIKLGLYHKNELVSLMTFGKRMIKSNVEFELIRFCNKINLNVIGSASKLFNYFKQNYRFNNLISYSDFRLFDGKMYQTLGFTKQHLSKPDYFWCKGLERKHRFNFNKQKLIKDGFDSSKTEVEIMHERGYFRLFGCGQYRWKHLTN